MENQSECSTNQKNVLKPHKKTPLHLLALCALFAALTAILSQLAIPIGPVPLNLATFSVLLAGGLLGAKYGAISQTIYVLLGLVGVPVFSSFRGGLAVLAGPTGGYIIGYIIAAWLTGMLAGKSPRIPRLIISMTAGSLLCYIFGTLWFLISTKTGLWASLVACVFPFLPGDAVKIMLASLLVPRLRQAMRRFVP